MTVIKYWQRDVRVKVQKSLAKFKPDSKEKLNRVHNKHVNILHCFGILTAAEAEARNVVIVDEEYEDEDDEDDEDD